MLDRRRCVRTRTSPGAELVRTCRNRQSRSTPQKPIPAGSLMTELVVGARRARYPFYRTALARGGRLQRMIRRRDERPDGTKVCADCAETVKAQARICRFCGYRFERLLSIPAPLVAPVPTPGPTVSLPRRGTPEFERELAATPGWRWLVDVPGGPAVPILLLRLASFGYAGLWPHMTVRQRAETAAGGWLFLGGFGAIVVWVAQRKSCASRP
jgi:hypothetical protein